MQTNCVARAVISPSGNTIQKIDVLDTGSGYRSAIAQINYDVSVPVTSNAELRVISSPPGGHGSDVLSELFAKHLIVGVKFAANDTPYLGDNDFRTVGLLKAPLFDSVTLKISEANTTGELSIGEKVFSYSPTRLYGSVATTSGNTSIVGTNTAFRASLSALDYVLIESDQAAHLSQVSSVVSNTSVTLTTSPVFTDGASRISLVRDMQEIGYVSGRSLGEVVVSNAAAKVIDSLYVVGLESSCTTTIDDTLPSDGRVKIGSTRDYAGYDKFTQLTKFSGTLTSGTFVEDELVTQDNGDPVEEPTARFHSLVDLGPAEDMYITDSVFTFFANSALTTGTVVGSTSNAVFIIDNKYEGELVKDSGKILYLENMSAISRSNTQTETIKLIIKFA